MTSNDDRDYNDFRGATISGISAQGRYARADGGNARLTFTTGAADADADELRRRIEELQRLVAQYAAHLPDAAQLRDDAEELGAQMERERPNRTVVRGLLDSLTTGAGAVDAVLSAVRGLAAFVAPLL